jgi:hypothetical protein
MSVLTKARLSACRRRLLTEMQRINFGRIENLQIEEGEPRLDTATVIRVLKLGADNKPRPELSLSDFALKQPVIELFSMMSSLRNGTISSIELKYGMPFSMEVRESVA